MTDLGIHKLGFGYTWSRYLINFQKFHSSTVKNPEIWQKKWRKAWFYLFALTMNFPKPKQIGTWYITSCHHAMYCVCAKVKRGVKSITNCIVEIERLLKRPLRKFHEHESNKLPTNWCFNFRYMLFSYLILQAKHSKHSSSCY